MHERQMRTENIIPVFLRKFPLPPSPPFLLLIFPLRSRFLPWPLPEPFLLREPSTLPSRLLPTKPFQLPVKWNRIRTI